MIADFPTPEDPTTTILNVVYRGIDWRTIDHCEDKWPQRGVTQRRESELNRTRHRAQEAAQWAALDDTTRHRDRPAGLADSGIAEPFRRRDFPSATMKKGWFCMPPQL
jgi:hypothetical protein